MLTALNVSSSRQLMSLVTDCGSAGDSYNLIGRAVDHRHNHLLPHIVDVDGPITHSVCYVDDGIGVAPHLPLLPTNDGGP